MNHLATLLPDLMHLIHRFRKRTGKGIADMILIDYKDRRPLYEQIVEKLSDLMVRGVLAQDSQLPSVRSLATELSINPNTIQRAYAELERQGYIYSVKGRGSFVAENHQIRAKKQVEIWRELALLVEDARNAGITMEAFQAQVAQNYEQDPGTGAGQDTGTETGSGAGQGTGTETESGADQGMSSEYETETGGRR